MYTITKKIAEIYHLNEDIEFHSKKASGYSRILCSIPDNPKKNNQKCILPKIYGYIKQTCHDSQNPSQQK